MNAQNDSLKEEIVALNLRVQNLLVIKEMAEKLSLEYNKTLMENVMLRDLLQDRMPQGCIAETTYQPILDENENLKEENAELKEDIEELKQRLAEDN